MRRREWRICPNTLASFFGATVLVLALVELVVCPCGFCLLPLLLLLCPDSWLHPRATNHVYREKEREKEQ